MQYFIGIVPPEEFKQKIIQLQQQWVGDSTAIAAEPHITVKAQSGLHADLQWLPAIEKICAAVPPFKVTLKQPDFFGDAVLFLTVESPALVDLHSRIVHEINPAPALLKKYMELNDYVPHLTLGQTKWGLSSTDLKNMGDAAKSTLTSYPTFGVRFLRIYKETELNTYVQFKDLELKDIK